jgi:hypothetical protein
VGAGPAFERQRFGCLCRQIFNLSPPYRRQHGHLLEARLKRRDEEDRPEYFGAKCINSIQVRKIGATDGYNASNKNVEAGARVIGNTKRAAEIYIEIEAAENTRESSRRVDDVDKSRKKRS